MSRTLLYQLARVTSRLTRVKSRVFRISAGVCGAGALAVTVAACGSSSTGASSAAGGSSGGGTAASLTIGFGGSVAFSLNPYAAGSVSDLLDPVYDTLIHFKDGQLVPWLATSWTFKNPRLLELKLRSGVSFTDGTPFDANAVKANIEYAIKTKAPSGDQIFLPNIIGMTVVNPTTLDLKLKAPNPALPYDFSQESGYMASPKALQNPTALGRAPVGTGPYILDASASTPGVSYVFTRNPHYWAASQNVFPFNKVTFSLQASPTALTNAAASGQVQALTVQAGTPPISGFKTVVGSGNQSGFTGAWLDVTGTALKAMGNQQVRQALNYAINRKQLAEVVYKSTAIPVPLVPVTPADPAYTPQLGAMYPYDPAKAKQMLAAAGYASGLTLTMISIPEANTFAQAMAGELQQVGVKVNIEVHTTDLLQAVQSGTRPSGLLLTRPTGDFGQDMGILFSPNAFYNIHHADDPQLDALLEKASLETDPTKRNQIDQQAAIRGAQDAWFLGTMILQTVTDYNPKVVTVIPPARGNLHLYDYHLPS